MANNIINSIKFNNIPFFDGTKGFAVIYLSGEFHLFFPYSTFTKGWIMHFRSTDGYEWEQMDEAVFVKKSVDSCSAYIQNGKIYLHYLTKNIFGKTDLHLAVSKDGENFQGYPNALLKNTALKDIKCFYSNGMRYLIGSETNGDIIPAYSSIDGAEWVKCDITCNADEQNMVTYLGAPSPFVAYDGSYVAYSMCGVHIAKSQFDLTENTLTLQSEVHGFSADTIRSTMVGEGKPMLFVAKGNALVSLEVYPTESGLGLRLYREMLKGARKLVDKGVEEGKTQPTEWMRESDILHLFSLPKEQGVSLGAGDVSVVIGESGELSITSEEDIYMDEANLDITLLDMGDMVVLELNDCVYPIFTLQSGSVKVGGAQDFSHECYRVRGNYEL